MISAVGLWRFVLENSILLLAGTIAGLLWANLRPATYQELAHTLHFPVNDVGMTFFFALAAKEVVEATASGGALHSGGRAAMPLLAAVGGMAGPAIIFLVLATAAGHDDLFPGWAIPCATDIAFSYLVARLIFGTSHPAVPFLLLLAIADDALGLAILAVFYPSAPLRPIAFFLILGAALSGAVLLRSRGYRSFWPYIAGPGLISWMAFYQGGLHPALALTPIIALMPHRHRDPGLFVDGGPHLCDTLSQFEHWWKGPVQGVLFFFGLVNGGVPLVNTGAGTWIVLVAILAGKPMGIVLFAAAGTFAGLKRPSHLSWRDLVVVGCAGGIGFTVALFFATAAFPEGTLLDQTKMGALFSVVAAPLAVVMAAGLRVGRWRAGRRLETGAIID